MRDAEEKVYIKIRQVLVGFPAELDQKDFTELCRCIHAALPYTDDRYVAEMTRLFGVPEFADDDRMSALNRYLASLRVTLIQKVNEYALKGTAEAEFLLKNFRMFDNENTEEASLEDLRKVFIQFGIDVKPELLKEFFKRYDKQGKGKIDYVEFAKELFPDYFKDLSVKPVL